DHHIVGVAQCLAGADLLKAGERDDVARIGLFDVLAVVRVHLQHAADAFTLLAGRVVHGGAALEHARVNAAEGDGADEGVVHDLEGKQRKRLFVVRPAHDLIALVVHALERGHVDGRLEIVDYRIKKRLHALVLEGGTGKYRKEGAGRHP